VGCSGDYFTGGSSNRRAVSVVAGDDSLASCSDSAVRLHMSFIEGLGEYKNEFAIARLGIPIGGDVAARSHSEAIYLAAICQIDEITKTSFLNRNHKRKS
jgi:hypothetical protein